MFFRMLMQSLLRGRRRKALAVATFAISAALISALATITINIGDKMSRELKSYGANITLVPESDSIPLEIGGRDLNPLRGRNFLTESSLAAIKEIFWRNNIIGFAPFLDTTVLLPGETGPVPLVGTWFDKQLPVDGAADHRTGVRAINPFWHVSGDWPHDTAFDQVLAGASFAASRRLRQGDRIRVRPAHGTKETELLITGILKSGGTEDHSLVSPLGLVQRMTGQTGRVRTVSVSALTVPENSLAHKARREMDALDAEEYDRWYCTAYVSTIAHQIEEALPGAVARPVWQVAAGEGAVMDRIQSLLLVVTMAAFITSSLGIASLMSTIIMERSAEIALMKALGSDGWRIYLLFLSEAGLIGIVGGIVGMAIGFLLAQLISIGIFDATLAFPPILLPVISAVSLLIALAGSVAPCRLITGQVPAEVLHGAQ